MQQQSGSGMTVAVVIAFLAVGIPYWLTPYNTPDLMDRAYGPALPIGAALPAAVFVRVVIDGFRDPTSHNLWPFEVVIAMVAGTGCAAIGAGVGSLLVKLRGGDNNGNDNDGDRR